MDKKRIGFVKKGKKEFRFNIDRELIRYKVVTGERLTKTDEKFIDDYNQKCQDTNGEELELTENYMIWREGIINKYKGYSKEELEAFEFHLNHGAKMKMSLKELTANLAMPIIVGIMLLYFEQFFNSNNEPLAFILSIIGFVVLYAFCIVKGMGLIEGFNIKQEVYEAFSKIIKEMINEK